MDAVKEFNEAPKKKKSRRAPAPNGSGGYERDPIGGGRERSELLPFLLRNSLLLAAF
jgi:hypothetical protein